MRKLSAILLSVLICALSFPAAAAEPGTDGGYLRGVWVSSVANLDYPSAKGLSPRELKAEADKIIQTCVETGMNAVFFQVRPCADSLYESEIFPKSVFLTGESSYNELEFDPLEYLTEKAHENNIQLHAWLNPYRVTRLGEKEYQAFDPESPQRLHPEYLLKTADGNYFFNPALPEVRELITAGAVEIIEKYDVDGIHFDDYFYPEGQYDDSALFAASGSSDIVQWRIENVNSLVKQVHDAVKAYDSGLAFGISPRGVWANDYEDSRGSATRGGGSLNSIYCDSLRFIDEGWVDYICPQIYWNIGFPAADYAILAAWWAGAVKDTGVKLYIGMADYRIPDAAEDSPWHGTDELKRQRELNKTFPQVSGEVHFRYGVIASNPEILDFYRSSTEETQTRPLNSERLKKRILIIVGCILRLT